MPTSHSISWLIDSDISSAEIGIHTKKIQIPYPPTLAQGYSEHFDIVDGITLIQTKHQFFDEDRPPQIPLGKFKAEFPSASFTTQIMHSGCVNIFDTKTELNFKRTPEVDVFSRIQSFEIEQTVCTEEDISVSILIFSEHQLIHLLGEADVNKLYKNLNLQEMNDSHELKVPAAVSNKIANCISDNLQGNMRSLYAQSMIFQYLIDLSVHASSTHGFLNLIENTNFNIDHLYTELLQITADIPTLTELAKKYNISPSRLNQAFIHKYNQSIYSFLSNQRLEQAHQALIKTNIPMKTLAHKIGYSHVNHFITAFKKKFGVTPGSIRN
jgi:AraC-like DNA-binding protein